MERATRSGGRGGRPGEALRRVVLTGLGLALGASAAAHHSIGGMYDSTRKLTFAARVTEFQFVNPHPYVIVDADPAATGAAELYRFEMDNRHELSAIGITAATFAPGDEVVVTGTVSRTDPHHLYLWRLDRATDGLRYEQVGTRPRISRERQR